MRGDSVHITEYLPELMTHTRHTHPDVLVSHTPPVLRERSRRPRSRQRMFETHEVLPE